jgi:signal transduction histidine kinase/CheY-like chemotaxis protein
MTLHVRLILITFIILIISSFATTLIYYNLTGQLLSKYQTQNILNSTNDFVFTFQNSLQQVDEDFNEISPKLGYFKNVNLDSTGIDFIFTLVNDSLISNTEFRVKSNNFLNFRSRSFRQLFTDNPNIVLRYNNLNNGKVYYYGFLITSEFLDKIGEKINADVALVINNAPVEISKSNKNQTYLLSIINAINNLKFRNNYDIFSEELENVDFESAKVTPHQILTPGGKISFIVFNTFQEGVSLRETLKNVMFIIVVSGSALTFIIVLLFTTKLRKQIALLSEAAEIIKHGNLKHRVPIISKDEVGKLGETFNSMLDEINRKEEAEKEYTEFITLMNQNPTLKEVSEAALTKIIKSTNLAFGVLYLVEENNLRLISSSGIGKNIVQPIQSMDLYSNAIEKKEVVEFNFHENYPEIKTGLTSVKLKYILIYPIINNKETIAILELASESEPAGKIKEYISNIHEQLAIGLINARSLEQLENIVQELKRLNEEYQKQNKQILEQNEELKELHKQINEKAIELEKQRLKAVELTKVKSQFLASMSHELRTPLISILGLTELILKDDFTPVKSKERLGIVFRNGKKLLGMITNILEFSKIESGKIEIKKDNFLLNDLLEEIRQNIEPISKEKKLNFYIQKPTGKNFLVNTDKSKLEQILNNLLTNSVKFTEAGEIILSINMENNNGLSFVIKDTGIGISAENQRLIFSEFRQLDGSTSRKYGGAGLGLAITKRYVELLGGTLSVNSMVNQGAEFSFTIDDVILDIIDIPAQKFLLLDDGTSDFSQSKTVMIYCNKTETKKLIADYFGSYNYNILPFGPDDLQNPSFNLTHEDSIIFCFNENQPNIWQTVVNLKANISAQDCNVIIISILEKEKVGWMLPVHDILVKPLTQNGIRNVILRIESFAESKVSRIFFVSPNKEEFTITFGSDNLNENVKYYKEPDEAFNDLNRESFQIVLIDFDSFQTDALRYLFNISRYKLTKNVYSIFYSDKDSSRIDFIKLHKELEHLTLKNKNHPLDVLKDLKDRLKIEESIVNQKQKLIEENVIDNYSVEDKRADADYKHTVLIVDDDPDTLFTIGEIVKEMNYDTIFAHNGMECLVMLNHIKPDLILLDIMMPQMDGFETVKRIRSDSRFSSIPTIALTAYAMLDNKNVVTKNGFNDLVTKPVNSSLLASKINLYIKSKVSLK